MRSSHPFRNLLVALLCLWLPLQAAAGLWLPCHQLDEVSKPVVQDATAHQGCSGHQQEVISTASSTPDNTSADDPCYHCQVSCHFSSAVLLPSLLQPPLWFLPDYLITPGPSLQSALLDNPQRPPRPA